MSTSIKLNYGTEQDMLEINCGLLNTWFKHRTTNRHGNLEALARTSVNEWRLMIIAQEFEGNPAVYWLYSWDERDEVLPSYAQKFDILSEAALAVAIATVNIQTGHETERDEAMSWVVDRMIGTLAYRQIWTYSRAVASMVKIVG